MSKCSSIIVFTDPARSLHLVLVDAFFRAALRRDDIEIVALCDSARRAPGARIPAVVRSLAVCCARRFGCGKRHESFPRAMCDGLPGIARRYGARLLEPPERDVNDPRFAEFLRKEVKADVAVSLYCPQILKRELVESFSYAVNYHNSYLPAYRGMGASAWSIYNGERESGFSFHRLTVGLDEGPVLLQQNVPVKAGEDSREVDHEKILLASRRVEEVLDLISRREPGIPQGQGSIYYRAQILERTRIDDPSEFTLNELLLRLRAFIYLDMKLGGRRYLVTQLEPARRKGKKPPLTFQTRDGVDVRPTKFFYLPLGFYRVCERLHLLPRRITCLSAARTIKV